MCAYRTRAARWRASIRGNTRHDDVVGGAKRENAIEIAEQRKRSRCHATMRWAKLCGMLSRTVRSGISRATLAGALLLAVAACAAIPGSAPPPPWYQEVETIGIRLISARELKGMLDSGERLVVIDARDEVHYRNGRLPGAISIPAEDAPLMAVDARRPKRLFHPDRLPADRAEPLAFYCGGIT